MKRRTANLMLAFKYMAEIKVQTYLESQKVKLWRFCDVVQCILWRKSNVGDSKVNKVGSENATQNLPPGIISDSKV